MSRIEHTVPVTDDFALIHLIDLVVMWYYTVEVILYLGHEHLQFNDLFRCKRLQSVLKR